MSLTEQLGRRDSPVRQFLDDQLPGRYEVADQWGEELKLQEADTFNLDWMSARVGKAFELRIGLDLAEEPGDRDTLEYLPPNSYRELVTASGFIRDPRRTQVSQDATQDPFLWKWVRDERPQRFDRSQMQALIGCYAVATAAEMGHRDISNSAEEKRALFDLIFTKLHASVEPPQEAWQGLAHMWEIYLRNGRDALSELGKVRRVSPVIAPGFAVADMVVGSTMLDIKTERRPENNIRKTFDQLLSYTLLDRHDLYKLTSIAAYFGWHAMKVEADVETVIKSSAKDLDATLPRLRAGFDMAIGESLADAVFYKEQYR